MRNCRATWPQAIAVGVAAGMMVVLLIIGLMGSVVSLMRADGLYVTRLTGSSMEPHSYQGDMFVGNFGGTPAEGDVIVFWTGDGHESHLVCHRIVGESFAESGGWYTKGDNNEERDAPLVPYGDVVAVELAIVPRMGFVASMSAVESFLAVFLAVISLVFLSVCWSIWNGRVPRWLLPRR